MLCVTLGQNNRLWLGQHSAVVFVRYWPILHHYIYDKKKKHQSVISSAWDMTELFVLHTPAWHCLFQSYFFHEEWYRQSSVFNFISHPQCVFWVKIDIFAQLRTIYFSNLYFNYVMKRLFLFIFWFDTKKRQNEFRFCSDFI